MREKIEFLQLKETLQKLSVVLRGGEQSTKCLQNARNNNRFV